MKSFNPTSLPCCPLSGNDINVIFIILDSPVAHMKTRDIFGPCLVYICEWFKHLLSWHHVTQNATVPSDVLWRGTILPLYRIKGLTGSCGVLQQKDDILLLCLKGSKIHHGKCSRIPGTQRQAQGVIVKIKEKNWGRSWIWLSHDDSNRQGVTEAFSCGRLGCFLITLSVQPKSVFLKLSVQNSPFA